MLTARGAKSLRHLISCRADLMIVCRGKQRLTAVLTRLGTKEIGPLLPGRVLFHGCGLVHSITGLP